MSNQEVVEIKDDLVEITLKIPKGIISFLKDMNQNVEEYLVRAIVCDIVAGLEADAWCDPKYFVRKHNLMPAFRRYEAYPSSYIIPNEEE